jgi:hypothetical protein
MCSVCVALSQMIRSTLLQDVSKRVVATELFGYKHAKSERRFMEVDLGPLGL